MPRRRTRGQPVAQEEVEPEEVHEAEEPEQAPQDEEAVHDDDQPDEEDMRSLQFDEELSWRPAKPIPSATLVARLERLSKELAEFDQGAVDLNSLKDVAEKLAHRNLLQHKDRGVKAYTACCLVDILRLFVPDAPFTGDQLKVWTPGS
jgi:sister chromatid cohesion protein PDS5